MFHEDEQALLKAMDSFPLGAKQEELFRHGHNWGSVERFETVLERLKMRQELIHDKRRQLWRVPVLLWTDLETTGLDPRHDEILEVAVVVTTTTPALSEVAAFSAVRKIDLDTMNVVMAPVVKEMHHANGLFDEIRRSDNTLTLPDMESALLAFLRTRAAEGDAPMCGSTINFDRAFYKHHMPVAEAFFHYRNVDVSSIGELARRWNTAAYTERPQSVKKHRALADVRESIEQLKWYQRHFLRIEG